MAEEIKQKFETLQLHAGYEVIQTCSRLIDPMNADALNPEQSRTGSHHQLSGRTNLCHHRKVPPRLREPCDWQFWADMSGRAMYSTIVLMALDCSASKSLAMSIPAS